ncbi:hypothetical protein, unlikely [Trypanosoma brucei gambiense DAL972]|uniref:Uncharacterized protein n=1 Tax=Trypanosoma brucei gambiense (strain MHOM/CI/86/DAL972) TaxID=679716 RepID=C9ZU63_TRYB9|nr:hypothetical protein, unlikely [Trypanosoma brucei gambiense DAL972]CBH12949.1 hypothetical protein, unlikely [Trypanosoma brucei gambiense DAL972]|eukprot:XP_011775228.1 hypothetical protein, unlikely [Trypanosoma brucei gambiense DAL972]
MRLKLKQGDREKQQVVTKVLQKRGVCGYVRGCFGATVIYPCAPVVPLVHAKIPKYLGMPYDDPLHHYFRFLLFPDSSLSTSKPTGTQLHFPLSSIKLSSGSVTLSSFTHSLTLFPFLFLLDSHSSVVRGEFYLSFPLFVNLYIFSMITSLSLTPCSNHTSLLFPIPPQRQHVPAGKPRRKYVLSPYFASGSLLRQQQ